MRDTSSVGVSILWLCAVTACSSAALQAPAPGEQVGGAAGAPSGRGDATGVAAPAPGAAAPVPGAAAPVPGVASPVPGGAAPATPAPGAASAVSDPDEPRYQALLQQANAAGALDADGALSAYPTHFRG